jgi:hypothetical protein
VRESQPESPIFPVAADFAWLNIVRGCEQRISSERMAILVPPPRFATYSVETLSRTYVCEKRRHCCTALTFDLRKPLEFPYNARKQS